MSFSPAPSSFHLPTAATETTSSDQQQQKFNIGTVTPKKSRNATKKPSVEKRSVNYKKGINSLENRKLRRTMLGEQRNQDRTRRISQRRRSGENNGLSGNTSTDANNNNNTTKNQQIKPRTEKKVYAGSAKDKLTQFYSDYNPAKVVDVDSMLEQYASKEEELFAKLAKKYNVDPTVFGSSKTTILTTPSKFGSGFANKRNDTPYISSGNAFAAYAASPGRVSFGSLATPKKGSTIFGFGPNTNKPSIFGDNTYKSNKGRTTITSLRTYSDGCRALGNGNDDVYDSDDMMECD